MGEGSIFTAMIGALGVFLILLGVAGLILWIVLPFSVFGIKGLIREVLLEQKKTNELLKEILYKSQGSGNRDKGFPPDP